MQILEVVDLGAHEVLEAHGIYQELHPRVLHHDVVFRLAVLEQEAVLEAGAAATLDVDAKQRLGEVSLRDELAHFARGRGRERDTCHIVFAGHGLKIGPVAALCKG